MKDKVDIKENEILKLSSEILNCLLKDHTMSTDTEQHNIFWATSDYEDDGLFSFIDWAGNPDGSTQYRVTSVDYQGNESGIITPLDTTPPNVPTGLNIL